MNMISDDPNQALSQMNGTSSPRQTRKDAQFIMNLLNSNDFQNQHQFETATIGEVSNVSNFRNVNANKEKVI